MLPSISNWAQEFLKVYLELIPDNERLLQRAEYLAEGAEWQAKPQRKTALRQQAGRQHSDSS